MRLIWVDGPTKAGNVPSYQHGYWVAQTDDAGHDGAGPDPLTAVCALVAQIEREHPS